MIFSSSLTRADAPLVLDTSTLINLRETGIAMELLNAIPNRVVIAQVVEAEFQRGSNNKTFLLETIFAGCIESLELTPSEEQIYFELINDLDDGESATIAIAGERNWIPVVDENKGRSILAKKYPLIQPIFSVDIFMHSEVLTCLGEVRRNNALFTALKQAHMRIPEQRNLEVIRALGSERASVCTSLANYKLLFPDKMSKFKN